MAKGKSGIGKVGPMHNAQDAGSKAYGAGSRATTNTNSKRPVPKKESLWKKGSR